MTPLPWRVIFTAACADFAAHTFNGVLSHHATGMGAARRELGWLSFAGEASYVVVALGLAGLSDRVGRRVSCRAGMLLSAGAMLAAWAAHSLLPLVCAYMILRASTGLFWPALQARLADGCRTGLARAVGAFNLGWSAGKATAFATNALLFGGILTAAAFTTDNAILVAAVAAVVTAFVVPRNVTPGAAGGTDAAPLRSPPAPSAMKAAWIGNFVATAAFTVLVMQNAPLMNARGFLGGDARSLGNALLSTYVASQALAFFIGGRLGGLMGKPPMIVLGPAVLGLGLAGFALSSGRPMLLACVALCGIGSGLAYMQSLVLSLQIPRGSSAGGARHEAILGAGNALMAPLAGEMADGFNRADAAVWTACAAVAVAMFAQMWVLRRGARAVAGTSALG